MQMSPIFDIIFLNRIFVRKLAFHFCQTFSFQSRIVLVYFVTDLLILNSFWLRHRYGPKSLSSIFRLSTLRCFSMSLSFSLFVPQRIRRHRFATRRSEPVLSHDRN